MLASKSKVQICLLIMVVFFQLTHTIKLSHFSPEHISHKLVSGLGIDKFQRRLLSVNSITDLVGSKFDSAGYVPFGQAASRCESSVRSKVERTLQKIQREAMYSFTKIGEDLQARCRSYVEYAGNDCRARLESVGETLLENGRELVNDENDRCRSEIEELTARVQKEEEERYRIIGDMETQNLTEIYQDLGKVEEQKIRSEIEERQLNVTEMLTEELTNRGLTERDRIVREFEALGEAARANITVNIQSRGFNQSIEIRQEFEERGEKLEAEIRAEYEEKGEQARKDIEDRFRAMGRDEEIRGENSCDCMLKNACENVKSGGDAEEICRGVSERLEGVNCDKLDAGDSDTNGDNDDDNIDDGLLRFRRFRHRYKYI